MSLTAIQLLPFIEYLTQSASFLNRNSGEVAPTGLPIQYAWTLVSPDLFGNPAHDTWWARKTNYNESNAYAGVLPLLLLTTGPVRAPPRPAAVGRRGCWR